MKITNIEAFPVSPAGGSRLFVVVDTDEGIYGVGESGLHSRALAVAGCIQHFAPLIIGQDPLRIEHLWQLLFRGGFFPAGHIAGSAIAAVDIALHDIKGKALEVPVYQLLGGRVRDKVVCYPHNNGRTVEQLVESCLRSKEEGWKFVRWGLPSEGDVLEPTRAVQTGVQQLRAVREAVGDELEICFDVHTRLDLPDAIRLLRAAEQYRPFFMEDSLRSENAETYRQLRQHVNVPLAAGEQFATKWEFRPLVEQDLIDYARIDVCICGGLTEAKKIAGWCETHYIKLATHNPLGPVSTAACLHLNLACSNFGVQEQPRRPGAMLTDLIPVQVDWQDGYLLAPERPGLGVEIDRQLAARLRDEFEMHDPPRLRRIDGSLTNW